MTTWQNPGGGFYPGQQGYPGGYPGGPEPGGYPGAGYPPPGGFPGGYPGGYPSQGSFPGGPPPAGFVPPPVTPHIPPSAMYGASANYAEDPMRDEVKGFQFSDKTIRQGFIKKVYLILMLQLVVTFGMVALFTFHPPAKNFARANPSLLLLSMVVTFVVMLAMACCTDVRRKAPMNFIFLGIFTVAEGFVLGVFSSVSNEKYVVMAVGITAVICLSLTLFSFQTKYDFTGAGTYLFVAAICLMIFGFILMFIPGSSTVIKIYSSLGALLFSFYLVYDTQLMLGGNHKYSLSPEEYIFAALNIYLDIVNIFIYILSILNASSND